MADEESGGVVVDGFLEYEDVPYVRSGARVFRMRFKKDASRGYILEPLRNSSGLASDVALKGSSIAEGEAKALL